jgi:hypothetical protein
MPERETWEREWDAAFAAATTRRQKNALLAHRPRWTIEELRAFAVSCRDVTDAG